MDLRPYQIEAIHAVEAEWQRGIRNTLGVAATGAGKTIILLSLALRHIERHPDARIVVLAHREELISQPVERLRQLAPAWLCAGDLSRPRVGLLLGDQKSYDRQLTIATVQTLSRPSHLQKLLAHGPIDVLITDEAH